MRWRQGGQARGGQPRVGFDIVLGLVLAMLTVGANRHGGESWDGPPWARWNGGVAPAPEPDVGQVATVYAVAVVVVACVALRRVWTRTAVVVAAVAIFGYLALGHVTGPMLGVAVVLLLAVVLAMPPTQSLLWGGLLAAALVGGQLVALGGVPSAEAVGHLVRSVLFLAFPGTIALMIRGRREAARREHDQELRRHRYEERLRIAREVHDIVGHSLSVINMQAGVALHVLDKRPEQAAPALDVIRRTSKDALTELRGTLTVFRGAEHDATERAVSDRAPLRGLARLGDLTDAVTAEGREVTVETEGTAVELPTAVDHAAYRIVQEALTNAVRHAGPATVRVRIGYHPDWLVVEVTDDGRGSGTGGSPEEGGGLAGMRERTRAVGGTLRVGPRPEGGFEVRAVLPLGGD